MPAVWLGTQAFVRLWFWGFTRNNFTKMASSHRNHAATQFPAAPLFSFCPDFSFRINCRKCGGMCFRSLGMQPGRFQLSFPARLPEHFKTPLTETARLFNLGKGAIQAISARIGRISRIGHAPSPITATEAHGPEGCLPAFEAFGNAPSASNLLPEITTLRLDVTF